MKTLILTILLSTFSCQQELWAKQYNVGPYSKSREVNGRQCEQIYIYEAGRGERYMGMTCS